MKKNLNWWCDRAWILFECLLAGCMMGLMMICWEKWGTALKVICSVSILLPLHVVEEWVFPGGFHYQYNAGVFGSEVPDRYPMCRLSDMCTNMIGTVFFMVLTFAAMANGNTVRPGILMATAVFSGLEFLGHTLLGCKMYFRFRDEGKRTIYGPGSLTAYFGFAPLGILAFSCIRGMQIKPVEWQICLGMLVFMIVGCILIPEGIIKKKDSPYSFENAGYFERFLRHRD